MVRLHAQFGPGQTFEANIDVSFYPAGEIPVTRNGDAVEIVLPRNAIYVVLQ